MLYRPEAYEPLTASEWRDGGARAAIRAITTDAEDTFDPDRLWPADEWDAWTSPLPLKSLYVGAAGVIWALDVLRGREHVEPRIDLGRASARAVEAWRAEPDLPDGIELPSTAAAGFLSGEGGILLVAWLTSRRDDVADALHRH